MKTLKFLFVAVLLSCIAITQTNAQAEFIEWTGAPQPVVYIVDGTEYFGIAQVDVHAVISGNNLNWIARGYLVEAYEWDGIFAGPTEGGIPLPPVYPVPLPERSVKGFNPGIEYYELITVSPTGLVMVNAHLPQFRKFDPLF